MKLQDIKINLLEYIFITLTILNYISMYYRSPNSLIHIIMNIVLEIILLYLFMISINQLSNIILTKYINFSVIYSIIIFISLILYYFYFPYSLNYIIIYLINPLLLIALFLSDKHYLQNELLIKFENITVILSFVSFIFWILKLLNISTNNTLNVQYGSIYAVPSYFNIDFFPQTNINFLGINNIPRNSGIFSEPSMFSYVLCIAFLIELFINNKKNSRIINFKIVILFITILSTTSTTGIMIAFPSLLIYLAININNKLLRILFLIVFPIVFILFKFIISNKISNVNDIMSSYSIRMNDMYSSFMAWKQHLFIGNGLGNDYSISQFMYTFRFYDKNTGSSAGIPTALSYGGIIYGLFYIIPNLLSLNKNRNILIFSIFILILNIFTNVLISYTCIFILSYLWAYTLNSNKHLDMIKYQ